MSEVLLRLLAASPSPSPAEVVDTPPPELVTPGTIGFVVTFLVAVALVLLVRDMNRRVRRIRVRAELEERRDASGRSGGGPGHGPDDPPEAGITRH